MIRFDMVRLGLRLAVSGGREALVRLAITAGAVAIGVGLLFTTLAAINGVHSQNARNAWLNTPFVKQLPANREVAGSSGNGGSGTANASGGATGEGSSASGGETGAGSGTAGAAAGANGQASSSGVDPMWWSTRRDTVQGKEIGRIDVALTGPRAALSPGVPRMPGPGEYYLSPALARMVDEMPPAQLGDRFPGHRIGILGDEALPAPDSLLAVVGRAPQEMKGLSEAALVNKVATTRPDHCADCVVGIKSDGVDLILTVVSGGLVFPVLILIGTSTRLNAARREQRFAAMRLVGATPRQVSVVSAVEAAVAAVVGVVLGFLPFLAVRGPVADMALTGSRFFTSDVSLTPLQIAGVALGVPLAAAVAARIALRRVQISPLGVTRRVTPKPPRAWRVIPLVAGLVELAAFLIWHPDSVPGQVRGYLSSFLLIALGLVLSGPWLTMKGAALIARRTQRPATLIAVRRLADNPAAGFRAVSGLVLALLVMTATLGVITTMADERNHPHGGQGFDNVLVNELSQGYRDDYKPVFTGRPAPPELIERLHAVPGVRNVLLAHPADKSLKVQASDGPSTTRQVVACADLEPIKIYGHCAPGAQTAYVPSLWWGGRDQQASEWPAAPFTPEQLATMGVLNVVVDTDGSPAAVEQTRTMVDAAYPAIRQAMTLGEAWAMAGSEMRGYQQLADVVILATFPIAGCSLAVSVAGGLSERKRPFSLLRLTGVSLGTLRRVVAMESVVPLLVMAAVAIGVGLLAADLFLRSQLQYSLHALGAGYYLAVIGGLTAALAIIGATMPLLRRITGPETARNE
ncbi:FtsX-like permease family protein [Kitasatospora sp. NPDC048407]|uniref:ABC transporter permease n=1 Tax=Kitasatospora sp. NPDC048407 TaxID=3364051 RepID=UPI0037103C31